MRHLVDYPGIIKRSTYKNGNSCSSTRQGGLRRIERLHCDPLPRAAELRVERFQVGFLFGRHQPGVFKRTLLDIFGTRPSRFAKSGWSGSPENKDVQ